MLKDYLQHIGNTMFSMYQEPFSHDWDICLTRLMDEGEVITATQHLLVFSLHGKSYGVWTCNRWYSYGHLYEVNAQYAPREFQFRPRFRTMRRLNQLHKRHQLHQFQREIIGGEIA